MMGEFVACARVCVCVYVRSYVCVSVCLLRHVSIKVCGLAACFGQRREKVLSNIIFKGV